MRRAARFFFMHVGSFVPVFVYFYLCGKAAFAADGVRHALLVALVVDSAYIALARSQGEAKQFDAGIWTLFAAGTIAAWAGVAPALRLYQRYSPTLLFVALGLTALVPFLLGPQIGEPYAAISATTSLGFALLIYYYVYREILPGTLPEELRRELRRERRRAPVPRG